MKRSSGHEGLTVNDLCVLSRVFTSVSCLSCCPNLAESLLPFAWYAYGGGSEGGAPARSRAIMANNAILYFIHAFDFLALLMYIFENTPIFPTKTRNPPAYPSHSGLVNAQHLGALLLGCTLLLVTFIKCHSAGMISAEIIQILDLIDTNDPVLASESLLNGAELRTLGRETSTADTVGGLSGREKGVVVVVRHLVPKRLSVGCDDERRWKAYIKLFLIVGVAWSSTRYSPLAVKKSRSLTSSGQMPSAILTIHKNLLISSPE